MKSMTTQQIFLAFFKNLKKARLQPLFISLDFGWKGT
jgi:hypothetical protein